MVDPQRSVNPSYSLRICLRRGDRIVDRLLGGDVLGDDSDAMVSGRKGGVCRGLQQSALHAGEGRAVQIWVDHLVNRAPA
jgi:hypothetical protein